MTPYTFNNGDYAVVTHTSAEEIGNRYDGNNNGVKAGTILLLGSVLTPKATSHEGVWAYPDNDSSGIVTDILRPATPEEIEFYKQKGKGCNISEMPKEMWYKVSGTRKSFRYCKGSSGYYLEAISVGEHSTVAGVFCGTLYEVDQSEVLPYLPKDHPMIKAEREKDPLFF